MPHRPEHIAALPNRPTLGWSSFMPGDKVARPSVGDLPCRAYTTSGRAAIWAALEQLALPPGSFVLVPTYHCPTMVAPVILAGLTPVFFAIGSDGLPLLESIDLNTANKAQAMLVAHYFGFPKSLKSVQQWCQDRSISLIEDCAHSYFGYAGERPVGRWGDYATASLTKFFPISEAGLLASGRHDLKPLHLQSPSLRVQAKGVLDVLETSYQYGRLGGISHLLTPIFMLKHRRQRAPLPPNAGAAPFDNAMSASDMERIRHGPSAAAMAIHRALPYSRIIKRRRDNFSVLALSLANADGARLLENILPDGAAPYVAPLWVDGPTRADAVYQAMRSARLPVFRWDRIWPGTPAANYDAGPLWSRQVLQILCHQDLSADDMDHIAYTTLQLL